MREILGLGRGGRAATQVEQRLEAMINADSRPLLYAAMIDDAEPVRHLLDAGWDLKELDRPVGTLLCGDKGY